jgi:hypothetical protein
LGAREPLGVWEHISPGTLGGPGTLWGPRTLEGPGSLEGPENHGGPRTSGGSLAFGGPGTLGVPDTPECPVYQTPSHDSFMRSHLGLTQRAPGDLTPLRSLQTMSLVKPITIPEHLSVKSKSLLLHNFLFDARRLATMDPANSAMMSVKDRQVPSVRSRPVIYAH